MRELTTKQKNLLNKWFKENCPTRNQRIMFGLSPKFCCADDLSLEQLEILEKINDTEILYQNISKYLGDLYVKEIN